MRDFTAARSPPTRDRSPTGRRSRPDQAWWRAAVGRSARQEHSGRQLRPDRRGAKGPARRIRRPLPQGSKARIITTIGDKKLNRWHLQIADRWIVQYNLYVNDQRWGRIFVRMCPYLPFSARVCLNQHHWLANREESVDFQQRSNAFLRCGRPERLQELADTLTDEDLSFLDTI